MKRFLKYLVKCILSDRQVQRVKEIRLKSKNSLKSAAMSVINKMPCRLLVVLKLALQPFRRLDYQPSDIFLYIDSEIEYRVRLNSCKKEPETIKWIQKYFQKGDVFYDIGANVGAYSLVAAKHFEGLVKVYSFEPGFVTYPQLCKNIWLNSAQESVVPFQIGLSDETTVSTFNYSNLESGGALHALGEPNGQDGVAFKPVFQQQVLAYRLDDLIEQFGLSFPDHIKIDVDGIEFAILEGAEQTLKSIKSLLIEIEEGTENANRIIEFLNKRKLKIVAKHKLVGNYYNFLFSTDFVV
jgi:FkbM family methyltransferase